MHTDAGRVILTEAGQPVIETGAVRSDSRAGAASDQARWAAAESEKQRLYIEARRRAALTQLAGGGELARMGLEETPQEEPPSYSPRDPASQRQQSANSTSILVTSPSSPRAPVLQGQAYSTVTPPLAFGNSIAPSDTSAVGLGIRSTADTERPGPGTGEAQYLSSTSAEEKERMRLFFEQQEQMQNISSRPSASSLGHTSGNSSCIAAPPTTAHGTRSSEFLSAETEKDIMRKRYEAATRAVSAGHRDGDSSPRSSYQNDSPRQSSISSSHDYSRSGHYAYQNAHQEDEQMPERYEETANATAALRVEAESRRQIGIYQSAQEEKDLMRQRYQEAIAAAKRQNSESSVNTIPGPSHLQPDANSSMTGPSGDMYQGQSVVLGDEAPRQTESSYLTAAQEKEQMRQRYEAAVRAAQNSKATRSADLGSGHHGYSQSEDPNHDRQNRSRDPSEDVGPPTSGPPVLPPKPVGIEQYKAILSSPIEEVANPFIYMNAGMVPMYSTMFPGPVPGMDFTQAANGYYYQTRGAPRPEQ